MVLDFRFSQGFVRGCLKGLRRFVGPCWALLGSGFGALGLGLAGFGRGPFGGLRGLLG